MNDTDQTRKAPLCWCAYGGEGLESVHPQCPQHGSEPAPPEDDDADEEIDCDICKDEWNECDSCGGDGTSDYSGDGSCYDCGGSGGHIPSHCCACGGSPYCNCCKKCGGGYVGACKCPIPVQMSDGSTRTV